MQDIIALIIGITAIALFAFSLIQQTRPPRAVQVQIEPEQPQVGSGCASIIFVAVSLLLIAGLA